MSDLALTNTTQPPTKIDPNDRPPTGRTKRALDLMVHEGFTDNEAAVQIGITVTAIRLAIQRRGVRAYLNEQREVSRERICARNYHRLAQIRDKADNMPAVQAIKLLEKRDDIDGPGSAARTSPGLVIVIQGAAAHAPQAANPVQVIENTEDER
jgi:hypothetical protein